jgi:V-type H+-transporting ATPase subunit H
MPILAGLVLTKIISKAVTSSAKPSPKLEPAIKSVYSYLGGLVKANDASSQDIAVQSYSAILRNAKTRELFWKQRKETLDPLVEILRLGAGADKSSSASLWSDGTASSTRADGSISGGVGIELLYRVLLVIWQLSFEANLVAEGFLE